MALISRNGRKARMKDENGTSPRVIRCDIYAGERCIRSFPDDKAFRILNASTEGEALVLQCEDTCGHVIELETTLRYLLVRETPNAIVSRAKPARVEQTKLQ